MANEAVIINLLGQPTGEPIRYSCDEDIAIEKGTLMVLSGAQTAAKSANEDFPFLGIAATEYAVDTAVSGAGTIGVWTKGVFDLMVDAAGTVPVVGQLVTLSGANTITAGAATDYELGKAVGRALEGGTLNTACAVAVGLY